MPNLEQAIRERAYHLWLADGCRDGAADAYWLTAQREVLSASLSATDVGTAMQMPQAAPSPDQAPAKVSSAKAKVTKAATPAKSKRRAA